jgi:hypothetical protein
MNIFLKILNFFFVFLGVVFFVLLLLVGIFLWRDPFDLRPLMSGFKNNSIEVNENNESGAHPLLSPGQEAALESIGVDPSKLPTEITPEQENCAVSKLGEERVREIKSGSTPSISDYLKAKDCF